MIHPQTYSVMCHKGEISIPTLLSVVAEDFGVTVKDIMGTSRKKNIVMARHVFMWFLVREYGYGTVEAGRLTGRDHSTISIMVRKVNSQMTIYRDLWEKIQNIRRKVLYKNTINDEVLQRPRSGKDRPLPGRYNGLQ